jgi:hypothetical protein
VTHSDVSQPTQPAKGIKSPTTKASRKHRQQPQIRYRYLQDVSGSSGESSNTSQVTLDISGTIEGGRRGRRGSRVSLSHQRGGGGSTGGGTNGLGSSGGGTGGGAVGLRSGGGFNGAGALAGRLGGGGGGLSGDGARGAGGLGGAGAGGLDGWDRDGVAGGGALLDDGVGDSWVGGLVGYLGLGEEVEVNIQTWSLCSQAFSTQGVMLVTSSVFWQWQAKSSSSEQPSLCRAERKQLS